MSRTELYSALAGAGGIHLFMLQDVRYVLLAVAVSALPALFDSHTWILVTLCLHFVLIFEFKSKVYLLAS